MVGRKTKRLNLEQELPEGLLVDAAWLTKHGYSRQLWNHYVATGWLEQSAPRVYRRPRGSLTWQQAVISLQTLLDYPVVVGGRTALELQGYAHYLPQAANEVHLYGPKSLPSWLCKLPAGVRFVYHNDRKLFRSPPVSRGPSSLSRQLAKGQDKSKSADAVHGNFTVQPWGQWDWPLTLSTPERAVLELLDELPDRESFHQVDKLMEGLTNLSPRRLQKLLADCRNVKVKRLFFYFADRHKHAWLKRLNKDSIDLGKGKRMLAKGGKLDRIYQITVPEDLDGVR
jgi:Transcriptional regulator, AbiEi antitoxin, Type IV TA system/Transcriptional regulator, AbiEi antitoxin N-terminal domain